MRWPSLTPFQMLDEDDEFEDDLSGWGDWGDEQEEDEEAGEGEERAATVGLAILPRRDPLLPAARCHPLCLPQVRDRHSPDQERVRQGT